MFLILSAGSLYGIFFTPFFHVQTWEISINQSRIEKANPLNQFLAAEKGKNIFLINGERIAASILKAQPDIQQIVVKKVFPRKLQAEIEKYPTVANLINIIGENKIGNAACLGSVRGENVRVKKFLLNSMSYISEEGKEDPSLPYIRVGTINELTSRTFINKDKTEFLSPEKLKYVLDSIILFQERFDMKVIDASYFDREREIHLCTEKRFEIWIDMEKDLPSQYEKLKKAIPKLDIYNTALQYIDLRIAGTNNQKVIYKRK